MQDAQQSISIGVDAYVMSLLNFEPLTNTKLPQQPMLQYHKWELSPVLFADV